MYFSEMCTKTTFFLQCFIQLFNPYPSELELQRILDRSVFEIQSPDTLFQIYIKPISNLQQQRGNEQGQDARCVPVDTIWGFAR